MLYELLVRLPLLVSLEKRLRFFVEDAETPFRTAGELLFYTEKSDRRSANDYARFRVELDALYGRDRSDELFGFARKIYIYFRVTLVALRVLWVVLFLLVAWAFGRMFIGWGWSGGVAFAAAGFAAGASLEVLKRMLLWSVARRYRSEESH